MTTKVLTTVPNLYSRILSHLPTKHVAFTFAYGSGAVKQKGSEMSSNMIDFIIAVEDTESWHKENLSMNSNHYSGLKFLGHNAISKMQTNYGASVYYNTLIPIPSENVVVKYGVISKDDLINDLLDWCDLYIAGRLHKPVKIIQTPSDSALKTALQQNLHSAVHTALLLLPEHFSEFQFYLTIASLSYYGDFRVIIGEDRRKLFNILSTQLPKFQSLYSLVLKSLSDYLDFPICVDTEKIIQDGEKSWRQDISPVAKHFHLNRLPQTPMCKLVRRWNVITKNRLDTEDVLHAVAHDSECTHLVRGVLYDLVAEKSVTQSLKGIFTAGPTKSIKYSAKKVGKMFGSLRNQ